MKLCPHCKNTGYMVIPGAVYWVRQGTQEELKRPPSIPTLKYKCFHDKKNPLRMGIIVG